MLHNAEIATEDGGEIVNMTVRQEGFDKYTHYVLTVYFKDKTYYKEDCTSYSNSIFTKHIWVDEETVQEIIQKAINSHDAAVQSKTFEQDPYQPLTPHENKILFAINHALKKHELIRNYLPNGLEQGNLIVTQFADILQLNLNKCNKKEYYNILKLYIDIYTGLMVLKYTDEKIIKEKLLPNKKYIQDERLANAILMCAKKIISSPYDLKKQSFSQIAPSDSSIHSQIGTAHTKFCYNCGQSISTNDNFCPFCGAIVTKLK